MSAVVSQCGRYRYRLERELFLNYYTIKRAMLFIMLNPSTADAETDDNTIRRCRSFARRESATHLVVVNLFAYRETSPKAVQTALRNGVDIIGPMNDGYIRDAIDECSNMPVVAAWGACPFAVQRAHEVAGNIEPLYSLGKTKKDFPRHPLYVRNDQTLDPY